jgi:precorrin-8X/cobalt-precorrin-8 methylmutase
MKIEQIKPTEIEQKSFAIITEELEQKGLVLDADKAFLIKRCIHTTADFDYAKTMVFSDRAIPIMADLIRQKATIVTDTNMALSGINKKTLLEYGGSAKCFMSDPAVMKEAKQRGITRATVSMEYAAKLPGKVIYAIGNAPTALLSLKEMMDKTSYRPDFIIGVPVGFVNVIAAKEEIMTTDVPYIINTGRKGGSNVAAAICNAVLYEMKKGNL